MLLRPGGGKRTYSALWDKSVFVCVVFVSEGPSNIKAFNQEGVQPKEQGAKAGTRAPDGEASERRGPQADTHFWPLL